MNRLEFRTQIENDQNPIGLSFRNYFGLCLRKTYVSYRSLNRKIPEEHRFFEATGVEDALKRYAWPASIRPVKSDGSPYKVVSYEQTTQSLDYLSTGLCSALCNGDDIMDWVESILWWGMHNRGKKSAEFLRKQADPAEYLRGVARVAKLSGDTRQITKSVVRKYTSGLSKVHSLASSDGLIIYDSRVAFTIGECVNRWVAATEARSVPSGSIGK